MPASLLQLPGRRGRGPEGRPHPVQTLRPHQAAAVGAGRKQSHRDGWKRDPSGLFLLPPTGKVIVLVLLKIATLSPADICYEESLSTLRYAERYEHTQSADLASTALSSLNVHLQDQAHPEPSRDQREPHRASGEGAEGGERQAAAAAESPGPRGPQGQRGDQ